MAAYGLKLACALFVFNIMTRVCHAASASGYCSWTHCGYNGVDIRYSFILKDDALGGRCYTLYPTLEFKCVDQMLYLNFTGNISYSTDTFKVTMIDYWNQTLSLVPKGPAATCRPFDASRFGGLNITNTTTLLLDCAANIQGSCTVLPGSNISNVCNSTGEGVNNPVGNRWACPMTLKDYTDEAYRACYLMEKDPGIPNSFGASTATLELQFGGNRTLSFINFTLPQAPSPATAQPPGPAPTTVVAQDLGRSSKRRNLYIILGFVAAALIAASTIVLWGILRWGRWARYSSRTTAGLRRKHIAKMLHHPTTLFTLKELEKATKNFSNDFKLGSGGFGTLYKGTLDNGVEVAIKRTNRPVDMKGISEQCLNEVTLLSQVNHRNLVRLHGCCLEVEVPMLVYEYVSNGDLFQHLQGDRAGTRLSWEKRLQIAIDTAEALRYLHSAAVQPIYHRDVKTSNILLDDKFNVKVADFGISKLVEHGITHVSTDVQGTVGYLDPEYFQNFRLTDKSDVYSFGMVLLELLTSLKPVDFQRGPEDTNLKAMAVPFIRNRNLEAIVDPRLLDGSACESFDILAEMQRVGELASKCLADKRQGRPSMKEVVAELVAIRGLENRAGHGIHEMSDTIHEQLEMVPVLENQSSNFTSSSGSSNSPMGSIELVNHQNILRRI